MTRGQNEPASQQRITWRATRISDLRISRRSIGSSRSASSCRLSLLLKMPGGGVDSASRPPCHAGAQPVRRRRGTDLAVTTRSRLGAALKIGAVSRSKSAAGSAAPPGDGAACPVYWAAARVGCAAARTAAACLATRVPSKKRGFCAPHNRTALAKVKSRKSSAVMWPSSTSS